MQLIYEILPVFLFFMAFKFYDIYVATVVGIAATSIQVVLTRVITGKWDKKQLITMLVFIFFGGLTLYFHNPIFVKWKPTIIFWLFAIIIFCSQLFTATPLMKRLMHSMMEEHGEIPHHVWKKLNIVWGLFFACLGTVNLYVAYNYSNNAWVNFKFYGISGALFVLSIFQTIYLMKYITVKKSS